MSETEFLKIDINELLPQRPPFIMVGQLQYYDALVAITRFTIASDNIFCERGKMTAGGLIENFAQTCAARIGYYCKYVLHKEVSVGFIGAVKTLHIERLPQIGETIVTRIDIISEQFGLTLAHGEIHLMDGTLVAQGEMSVALRE